MVCKNIYNALSAVSLSHRSRLLRVVQSELRSAPLEKLEIFSRTFRATAQRDHARIKAAKCVCIQMQNARKIIPLMIEVRIGRASKQSRSEQQSNGIL